MNALILAAAALVVMPLLMGMNRARYFMLTGQTLNAEEALRDLRLAPGLNQEQRGRERGRRGAASGEHRVDTGARGSL